MRMLYPILLACLLLAPQAAMADHAPRIPLQEDQTIACQVMEQEHPACNVCGESYSENQARVALWIQLTAVAVGLGLILTVIWLMRCACCRLKLLDRIMRRGTERRTSARNAMPHHFVATLKGPFAPITATPVDVCAGGLQIDISKAQQSSVKGLKEAARNGAILTLTLTAPDGRTLLDVTTCHSVWVCGKRAGLAFQDHTDIAPLLEAGLAHSRRPM
ncbi:hypothetical protein SAMN04488082_11169 [Desulfomicrobium apsheronum]|uniref:PilZ domain-containing protein n=1 Tax=Desulfomicrobium apsheronum TaxID=52560 RepID=A0A1I3VVV1_9BACT|nr:hypothetical protein [Desulfomicrobium apsheronum]SFJ99322.1 hypothetical protein SAMN04488082_11169 [Desulfomicrobium apsheronum]